MLLGRAFILAIVTLVILRLLLGADLSVFVVFAPHDDSLYVSRALHLLIDGTLGPYDSRVLAKLPGISYLLAAFRSVGWPYVFTLNALYISVGVYVVVGLRRSGVCSVAILIAFSLYLFNPVTMVVDWMRVLREPLSTVLLMAMFGAMLNFFALFRGGQSAWKHAVVLGAALSIAMLVREEDALLWALLAFFAFAIWSVGSNHDSRWLVRTRGVVLLLVVPTAMILTVNLAARVQSERWYGLPIIHDYGEGEYPRLLAAIRGIVTTKDNRLVMVTQEALSKLRSEVPEFAPVIDRLPPPGPTTLSCRLQGVCSEWSNGWMPFWIKDAAYQAGVTPDLVSAQAYFRRVREGIESACKSGRLRCRDAGSGFLPMFELRWTRAFMHSLVRIAGMGLVPDLNMIGEPPTRFDVAPDLGRLFQAVTMTDYFDSQFETTHIATASRLYHNSLSSLRPAIAFPFQVCAAFLLLLSVVSLAYLWYRVGELPPDSLLIVGTVFYAFILLRMAALAYVSVYLGPFDSRVMFSNHIVALMLAPLLIAQAWHARRATR